MASWANKLVSKGPVPVIRVYAVEELAKISKRARDLYHGINEVNYWHCHPTWEQISETMQDTWRADAIKENKWEGY